MAGPSSPLGAGSGWLHPVQSAERGFAVLWTAMAKWENPYPAKHALSRSLQDERLVQHRLTHPDA